MNAQQIAWLPEEVRNHIAQLEHDLARLTAENEIETQELAAALRQMLLVIGKHNIEAPGLVRAQEALARARHRGHAEDAGGVHASSGEPCR